MLCVSSQLRKKGTSLVEVMIAMVLFSLGVLAVIGLFPVLFKANLNNWKTLQMEHLAQEKMDEIISDNSFISTTSRYDVPDILADEGDDESKRIWWGESDPDGNPNIQIVKVKIYWFDDDRVKTYTLTGAVAP